MTETKTKVFWLEIKGKTRPLWELVYQPENMVVSDNIKLILDTLSPYHKGDTIPGYDDCKECFGTDCKFAVSEDFCSKVSCLNKGEENCESCPHCIDGKTTLILTAVDLVKAGEIKFSRLEEARAWYRYQKQNQIDGQTYLCIGDV